MTYLATTQDPFAPLDGAAKKPHPHVPEPATYGIALVLVSVLFVLALRRRKP